MGLWNRGRNLIGQVLWHHNYECRDIWQHEKTDETRTNRRDISYSTFAKAFFIITQLLFLFSASKWTTLFYTQLLWNGKYLKYVFVFVFFKHYSESRFTMREDCSEAAPWKLYPAILLLLALKHHQLHPPSLVIVSAVRHKSFSWACVFFPL